MLKVGTEPEDCSHGDRAAQQPTGLEYPPPSDLLRSAERQDGEPLIQDLPGSSGEDDRVARLVLIDAWLPRFIELRMEAQALRLESHGTQKWKCFTPPKRTPTRRFSILSSVVGLTRPYCELFRGRSRSSHQLITQEPTHPR